MKSISKKWAKTVDDDIFDKKYNRHDHVSLTCDFKYHILFKRFPFALKPTFVTNASTFLHPSRLVRINQSYVNVTRGQNDHNGKALPYYLFYVLVNLNKTTHPIFMKFCKIG